jgi:DNA repair protein RadC
MEEASARGPREKMLFYGAKKLSDSELLTLLIGDGPPGRDDALIADEVLCREEFGLSYLSECSPQELAGIGKMGESASCRIAAAVEIGKRIASAPKSGRLAIGSPGDAAAAFMAEMRFLKNEWFKIMFLNVKNEVMGIEQVSIGSVNASFADPREVFRPAIKRGAAAIVLAHNHPSGNPEPSDADANLTSRLAAAGELLGIKLADHIIVGDGAYVSFREKGLI